MKKLNNQGFAISTILFSILILGSLVFGVLYSTLSNSKSCPDGCCEPPCKIPEKEEINTCSLFKDFSCPGEFKIGSEQFCVLKTYANSDTSINDEVVVALSKYYVNADLNKNNISPYGLQYKYAICENMHTSFIESSKLDGVPRAFYSIIDDNSKYNTKIKDSTFTVHPIWSDGTIGNDNTYSYKLTKLNTKTTLSSNPLNSLVEVYYNKLIGIDSSLSSSLVVRLLNLRDIEDINQFPCYNERNGLQARVRDDIDSDHTVSYFDCNISDSNKWIYSPTANTDFWGQYFIDIMMVNSYNLAHSNFVGTDGRINRYYYIASDDYDNAYFRPVIELSKTDYNKLPKV